jgi:hypothetical protein
MRRTIRAVFDNPETLLAEDVSQSKELKDLIKLHVPAAINDALIRGKTFAPVFEINDTNCYIEIHKTQWIQALETCLVWYVEDEDYEMCTHIKDMIQTIQNKTKSRSITINKQDGGE